MSDESIHRIDSDGRICFVNEAWLTFAAENGWPVSAEDVVGTALLPHISGPETRHIYRRLIDRAREAPQPLRFRYRCDSPDMRRFMEMRMGRGPEQQIEFRSCVLHLEQREPVRLLDPALPHRQDNLLQICSWCKAVYAQAVWLDLEEAVQTLSVLADAVLPGLSHGICPACSDKMTRVGGAL